MKILSLSTALAAPLLVYIMIMALHLVLPARRVKGYVCHEVSGEKLKYRLNGRAVLILSILIWFVLGFSGLVPYDWFYKQRFFNLGGAVIMGILFTLGIVLPYPARRQSLLADLFFGRLENPQYKDGFIDTKMALYLIGAVMLELNVLSFCSFHVLKYGPESSAGIILCSVLLSYFVFDYLSFEEVHLYTYDFFAEKVGFKLGWGCLAFYPFFYAIPLYGTVSLPSPGKSVLYYIISAVIFFCGWSLARGANMQKFYFKTKPDAPFLTIQPECISNGEKQLLVNGFWGLSRHINYLGEILMALGIVLSTGHPALWYSWLYPLYYIVLLFTRQAADDKRCGAKYGELWTEYERKVKYRIIPGIY